MNLTSTLCALSALAAGCSAMPAAAQTIFYEDGDYLYAVPAQSTAGANDTVTPVTVETIPADGTAQRIIPSRRADVTYPAPTAIVLPDPVLSGGQFPIIIPGQAYGSPLHYGDGAGYDTARSVPAYGQAAGADYAGYGPAYAPGYAARPEYLPNGAQLVQFDRQAWLSECRNRLAAYDRNDRARVIGALGGAVVGGIIGNRLVDDNRLAGTLAGAGAGALVGSAIGDAIDDRADRRAALATDDYCGAYLDDYLARASNSGGAATFTAGQQYMLVPVTVSVAQQTVYREYPAPGR